MAKSLVPKIDKQRIEELEGLSSDSIQSIFENGIRDHQNDLRPQQPGSWLYMVGYRTAILEDSLIEQTLKQLIIKE